MAGDGIEGLAVGAERRDDQPSRGGGCLNELRRIAPCDGAVSKLLLVEDFGGAVWQPLHIEVEIDHRHARGSDPLRGRCDVNPQFELVLSSSYPRRNPPRRFRRQREKRVVVSAGWLHARWRPKPRTELVR